MIIKQLSIFLENKTGRLTEVSEILGKSNINMTAFSIADTSDFGILRLIVSEPEKAYKVLKEHFFSVSITEVIGLIVPNTPGSLARALRILTTENINIEYLYAFSIQDKATVVIRTEDIQRCIKVLQEHKMELIKASELYSV
jgi:hypothetical protein